MTTQSIVDARSEKGIALVVVLLLMAVLSGLATGFAMNGRVEVAMAENEVYYAGARAAAEAGMNRATQAIRAQKNVNLLSGVDDTVDVANAAAAVNDDNGDLGFMLGGAGPYALGANNQYSYTVEVFDDDDPQLYDTLLSGAQLDAMLPGAGAENGNGLVDLNNQLILRAPGFGPNGTVVRLSRRISTNVNVTIIPPTEANPALLVDGDLVMDGSAFGILGLQGSVHANGDLEITGSNATVSGDATASGTFTAHQNFEAGGTQGGNAANINIPEINANDYIGHADYILTSAGTITNPDGSACSPCPDGWTWNAGDGVWESDNDIDAATYYSQTSVVVNGNPGSKATPLAVSIIAEGSITVTGTPKFRPENTEMYQFIADGDLVLSGNAALDDATTVEGQILVREQLEISGNPTFQGRILVQDEPSVFDDAVTNSVSGNPTLTYDGSLPAIPVPGATLTDYTYNVGGWMEQ
jgi:hypothetical protein